MENVTVFEVVEYFLRLSMFFLSIPSDTNAKNSFGSSLLTFDSKNTLATNATTSVIAKPMTI